MKTRLFPLIASLLLAGPLAAQDTTQFPTLGRIERLDARLDEVLAPDARIEVLAGGFTWCEGPVWVPDEADGDAGGHFLFSEIPSNSVLKWVEGKGVTTFLKPAGFTGPGDYGAEPGSNGLALDKEGRLVSCEHGDRRVSVLTRDGGKRTLADNWNGKRFNSPNDLTVKSNGDIYFTDPIYGLPKHENDPRREIPFCGVYRIDGKTNAVTLLTDVLERPNGIAFSPDEKTLYVAQSDAKKAIWMAFPVKADGTLGEGKVFKDVTPDPDGPKLKGLPDGMKVDKQGRLWASGPGGIHIMLPDGTLLGKLNPGENASNCCFGGADGKTLFFTADMWICRVRLK